MERLLVQRGANRWQDECVETFASKLRGKFNSCGHCPEYTTRKVWHSNKQWIECPVTKTVKSYECVTETCPVTVCKKVCVPEVKNVTCCRTVCEPITETITVNECRTVPYTATRCVTKCVPVQEQVTCCSMVKRCVEKQVPACDNCCNPCQNCGRKWRKGGCC